MKLSEIERLILWNQYEIRKHLSPDEAEHCENAQKALQYGYEPLYGQVLDQMDSDMFPQHKAEFVYDVLSMYDAFGRFAERVGKPIEQPFGKFVGFDGHGDLVSFTRFIVERLEKWKWLNIKNFDAHMPIEPVYARMLEVWKRKPEPDRVTSLTQEDVDAILAAAPHPDTTVGSQ